MSIEEDVVDIEQLRVVGAWHVVTPPIELDPATSPQLRSVLDGVRVDGAERVAVDWRAVTFYDSSAIGVLMGAHAAFAEAGAELVVICPPGKGRRIFDLMALDSVLSFVDAPEDLPA